MSYFYRQRVHFGKEAAWDESKHPRGKTTPKSTSGSFAPEGSPDSSSDAASTTGTHVSYKGISIDKRLVQASSTPAQTLRKIYGEMSEEEIRAELRRRMGEAAWEQYVEASNAAAAVVEARGDTQKQHVLRRVPDPSDPKGERTIPVYTEEREKSVHDPIIKHYLDRFKELADRRDGGPPEVVILAGRGGSGKSSFGTRNGEVTGREFGFYDTSYLEINPDEIKKDLYNASKASGLYPADEGLHPNKDYAGYWHEESSDLTKVILLRLQQHALENPQSKANVVLDLTLASNKIEDAKRFAALGYHTTMAIIDIPTVESAYNAVQRWQGGGTPDTRSRLVPVKIIANSKSNEKNFDDMMNTPTINSWFVYTGGDSVGVRPVLVAGGGKRRPRGNL